MIATNIAETSITIDDVVWVVDTGRAKENRYCPETHMQVSGGGVTIIIVTKLSRSLEQYAEGGSRFPPRSFAMGSV